MNIDTLSKLLNQFEAVTKKPEKYLSLQEEVVEEIKILTKDLYDFCKKEENPRKKAPETLNELVIKDLDEEQIWQQIELQNNAICDDLVNDVAHLLSKKDKLTFPLKRNKKEALDNGVRESSEDESKEVVHPEEKKTSKKKSKPVKSSIVDDKFFKLHEMETFLEQMEEEEKDDEDEHEEEVDYFDKDSSDDSENQLHYNDFFDEPEESFNGKKRKDFDMNSQEREIKKKKVKFELENDESDDDEDDDEEEEGEIDFGDEDIEFDENVEEFSEDMTKEEEDENESSEDEKKKKSAEQPSTFEARQERLKKRISNLEEEALREKSWQMKGEVTANSRPQNSLLQEYVEFDIATRPAPVLTEKSTLRLEDVIVQRIKDKAWDDVVRKVKPVEGELEYKKKLVLDQEKSKLSLAQIYEQEYLKQLDTKKNEDLIDKPEVEPPEQQEIRIMLNKLFSKLDALSNFHFTPKQVEPEVKIISNLPAVAMEEVAPIAVSDATLLAPEEVKRKPRGEFIGKSERTTTDKKRERRKKKIKQKLKHKKIEAKVKAQLEKQDSKSVKNNQLSQKLLQKITKSSNVIQLEENKGEKYIKSSNAFFSKLQDDSSSKIKKKGFQMKSQKLGKKLTSKKTKAR